MEWTGVIYHFIVMEKAALHQRIMPFRSEQVIKKIDTIR